MRDDPLFTAGRWYDHEMSSVAHKRKTPNYFASCAWCGERKPIAEMRHPLSSRGKTPSTCHQCRLGHPEQGWCDHHGKAHAREAFGVRGDRPIGIDNVCKAAMSYKAAAKRAKPARTCPSCSVKRESWFFRGGGSKAPACRVCEEENAGRRWCVSCREWLAESCFNRTGHDGKFWTVRCKPCRLANDHGVTQAHLADITGGAAPSCASCGSTESLKIDHDHAHCPSHRGCRECVRGFLCHQCNTAEGLLRSSERARMLAAYMQKWGL